MPTGWRISAADTQVKALPTFEGLRRALLEPEARLRIGEEWLAELTPKGKRHLSTVC